MNTAPRPIEIVHEGQIRPERAWAVVINGRIARRLIFSKRQTAKGAVSRLVNEGIEASIVPVGIFERPFPPLGEK